MSPTHQDLSNDTTFSQIKSRVPVPLIKKEYLFSDVLACDVMFLYVGMHATGFRSKVGFLMDLTSLNTFCATSHYSCIIPYMLRIFAFPHSTYRTYVLTCFRFQIAARRVSTVRHHGRLNPPFLMRVRPLTKRFMSTIKLYAIYIEKVPQ